MLLTRTPLARSFQLALTLHVTALPLAAHAQVSSAPAHPNKAAPSDGATVENGQAGQAASLMAASVATLPDVRIDASKPHDDFLTDKSSVGGKVPTAQRDIAQSVTVINQALMQSQGVTSFQDSLRNAPGITIGGAEGGQIGNNINLRGFTAQNDIYLDGFRDRNQYYRDTFDLESIDVLYGPSSMLFGRGSTGGVINQVSKRPNRKPSAEISTTIGTGDRYRTSVDLNHPLSDTAAFRVDAFGQSIGSTRDEMKNKDYGIAPSIRFGIGTPTEITISALIQHNYDMPDYGVQSINGHAFAPSKHTYYGLTDDRTIQDVQSLRARIDHKISDSLSVSSQMQVSHSMTDARETAARAVLTGPLASSTALAAGNFTNLPLQDLYVQLQSHDRVIQNRSISDDTIVRYTFNTGPISHDLIAGAQIGYEAYSNQAYARNNLPILSLIDPVYESTPSNVTQTSGNYAQSGATSLAAYLNDTISIGSYWKVVGGARWDRFQAHISNTINSPGYTAQTNYFTSVRAGAIYQPTDWQSYYFSYGTSFNPSLEALTVTNFTQNLAPEHTNSYEVGGKWDLLGGNLSVTSALFQEEMDNARTQVSSTEYTLDGDIRVRGFQAGVTGHILPNWQLFGGYTYMDATVLRARDGTQGHTPANTPRNTLTLWTTYNFTPHWQIGGGPTYMSARYAANTNFVQVGGYTRWDAMAAYHAKKWDLRLNLLNLTDKFYYDALIQSDGGRSVPGIGRTLLATFEYRL
jgi:catecholate siderophore receptor